MYQIRREEAAAQNMAQVSTHGFKALHFTAHMSAAGKSPLPVSWTEWTQGTLRETGRPLDVALEGNGFFVVKTAQGERLTRGGSLTLDPKGRLSDLSGNPLLGPDGPLVLAGGPVTVREDGSVLVSGVKAGTLRIEALPKDAPISRENGGLYGSPRPSTPVPAGTVRVRQGQVEESNVDPILSMVDLISIHRNYAAGVQALRALDGVLDIAVSDVGDA
jgi:flagellar basal body rod protein FlgG